MYDSVAGCYNLMAVWDFNIGITAPYSGKCLAHHLRGSFYESYMKRAFCEFIVSVGEIGEYPLNLFSRCHYVLEAGQDEFPVFIHKSFFLCG